MYDVSAEYELAKSLPAQKHRITGTISRDGALVSNINMSDIVEDSFSIRNQCCNNGEINFGSCYIGELSCEFIERKNDQIDGHTTPTTGLSIAFGSWVGLVIEPYFEIFYNDFWEQVPLGKYVVKEAHHTENGVQITAYDLMCNFDAEIPESNFNYLVSQNKDNLYWFAQYACGQCGVTLGMSKAEFDALPNATSSTENIEIYGDNSDKAEFSNDITTYRDLLYWIGQTMCCFATMNRDGELEFRRFPKTKNPDAIINPDERLDGMTLADYVTHVTGIYVTNLDDNKEMYYGSDAAALQLEIDDVTVELNAQNQALLQNSIDQAEVQEKYDHGDITEAEYNEQMAELRHAEKEIRANIKQLDKRLDWLNKALESASYAKASSIELGPNPFLMYGGKRSAQNTHRKKVLKKALALSYTPFSMSVVCGWHYDLGDLIQIAGGRFNSATDSFCCVMGYTFNLHGECTLEGYGENPALAKVKTKASRQANTANSNAVNAKEISSGTDTPDNDDGKSNDIYIKYATKVTKTPKVTIEEDGYVKPQTSPSLEPPADWFSIDEFAWDDQAGGYNIKVSGCYYADRPDNGFVWSPIIKANFTTAGTYKIVCDAKWTSQNVSFWWFNQPPAINGMTHYNAIVSGEVPVSCMWFGTTETQGQDVHCESNEIGIRQTDIDQGNIRFWLTIGMPQPPSDTGSYVNLEITGLKIIYIDPDTHQPDPDGGVNTEKEKYIDKVYVKTEDESGNKIWKEIEYVAGADTNTNSGLSLNYKRWLSLTPEVMRAIVKADPPQADVDFYRYCIRYTGDPDKTLSLAYNTATSWTNGSVKVTKEGVYTIKSSGAYNSGAIQQIAYKIEGLTSGVKYWFNFWARFTGAEFGEDFRKGLGLVWSTSNSINTDDWEGDPHTYNDTTKYLSFYRVNGKRYYEAGVTATASTMYMILTVGDLTDGSNITLTMGDMVISQTRKKYARSIYLYDVPSKSWIRYKPFGTSDDDGESDISYLNELNDVEIDNPTDGQVLTYQNGSWINGAAGGVDYVEISRANYNNLTPTEKADATKIYLVED